MLKVLLGFLLAVVATAFAMDNMHHVDLGLVVGLPAHVRLFFLLLTAFLVGCFSAMLMNLYLNAASGKQGSSELTRTQETEEEDFFSE